MQAFIVDSSLFMHCTALQWWFAPSIVMWLASAETFSPCAGCALHYGCVFVFVLLITKSSIIMQCKADLACGFSLRKVITFFMQSISMKVILGVKHGAY